MSHDEASPRAPQDALVFVDDLVVSAWDTFLVLALATSGLTGYDKKSKSFSKREPWPLLTGMERRFKTDTGLLDPTARAKGWLESREGGDRAQTDPRDEGWLQEQHTYTQEEGAQNVCGKARSDFERCKQAGRRRRVEFGENTRPAGLAEMVPDPQSVDQPLAVLVLGDERLLLHLTCHGLKFTQSFVLLVLRDEGLLLQLRCHR